MKVVGLSKSSGHDFSKQACTSVELVAGLGVAGDCHAGVTVQHLSRLAVDPTRPNLRQVHLIHAELLDELRLSGFDIAPGDLGENITTCGIDLLALPKGSLVRLGADAVVEVTGLRNPCKQIEAFRTGLLGQVVGKSPDGAVIRKTGVMAIVRCGGTIAVGDGLELELPQGPHEALACV
jgi:MOSC domain-containing protein YiiM